MATTNKPNKPPELNQLLLSADKGIGKTTGIKGFLAGLWRKILFHHSITPIRFNALINIWLQKETEMRRAGIIKKAASRANLYKELGAKTMTFAVFCKALSVLQAISVKVTLDITWKSGQVTTIQETLELKSRDVHDHDDDEPAPV